MRWGAVVDLWKKPPGRNKTLTQDDIKILQELVKDKIDWYLDELVGELEVRIGKLVSIPTLWRSLVYCKISRKKLHCVTYKWNELLRSTFIAKVGREYKPEQLIFMDETSKDECTLSRGYGYSLKNTFATKKNVFVRGVQYTILPALLLQGIIAVDIMEGSYTKKRFKEFIILNVVPQMNAYPSEYSVLVLDNARIHHDKDLIEYIEFFGERVEFLPPYSPNFNPIESSFSVIKSFLQKYRDFVNSCSDLRYPLLIAYTQITSNIAAKFFEDSIYM
ncbi:hypothetical protein RclHR1_09770011 [Rhizophagus clarus]|uniref:Tc1-like transposase DDE domain-containing protein n=1 Tax=Rhizophagus clarus TaxID=94130 RepID=A0A2Z6S5H1_9GLOM|nr:hypothetical protein RclHR1_09770011 [Rhizophagus clarus]